MYLKDSIIKFFYTSFFDLRKMYSTLFFRFLKRTILFIIIFPISFHFISLMPGFIMGNSNLEKEKRIKEIKRILERFPTDLASHTKDELAKVIYEEAVHYNHDPKIILAIISIESSFRNRSVSEKGAKGLMQIMPYVAEEIAKQIGIEWRGDSTLFNPFLNIKLGVYYLTQLITDFKNLDIALAAYNYGPSYVKSLIEKKQKIPIHYYQRVISTYQNL